MRLRQIRRIRIAHRQARIDHRRRIILVYDVVPELPVIDGALSTALNVKLLVPEPEALEGSMAVNVIVRGPLGTSGPGFANRTERSAVW